MMNLGGLAVTKKNKLQSFCRPILFRREKILIMVTFHISPSKNLDLEIYILLFTYLIWKCQFIEW